MNQLVLQDEPPRFHFTSRYFLPNLLDFEFVINSQCRKSLLMKSLGMFWKGLKHGGQVVYGRYVVELLPDNEMFLFTLHISKNVARECSQ